MQIAILMSCFLLSVLHRHYFVDENIDYIECVLKRPVLYAHT
jgi:hypothetical protein